MHGCGNIRALRTLSHRIPERRGKLVGISFSLTTVAVLLIAVPAYSQNLNHVICKTLKTKVARDFAAPDPDINTWKLVFNTVNSQLVSMAFGDNENYKVFNVPMRMTEHKFFWHFPVDHKIPTYAMDRTTLVLSMIIENQGNAEFPLYQCRQERL